MVVGVCILKFEINQQESGDINPEFREFIKEFTEEHKNMDLNKIITENERYTLFFNHTTGSASTKAGPAEKQNIFIGRLKETPYKVISYFHREIDESQYLIITIFKLEEENELFEALIGIMAKKIILSFDKLMKGNMKDHSFLRQIEVDMKNSIKFTLFQIERLSNLAKIQKVALIYSSRERRRIMELLREGPVSRKALYYELETIKENPNLDLILAPFIELNIVRRDWAKGIHDKKIGEIRGEGEYLFLIKDIALIRAPPEDIVKKMKGNDTIGEHYLRELKEFYSTYDPFVDLVEESRDLSNIILEPDTFDFLSLMKTQVYPIQKLPKIMSNFTNIETLLDDLYNLKIIHKIEDNMGRTWVCMLADIKPLVIFPEFLIKKIKRKSEEKITPEILGSVKEPITEEIAIKGLELLETTYNEKIEF